MPKEHRLRRREFPARPPKRFSGEFLAVSVSPAPQSAKPKVSCVVSRKIVARAVDRNRLKRQCREAARPLLASLPPVAVVLYPKRSALGAAPRALAHDVRILVQNALK